jgi:aspartate/methionine/tyrosine aminotransferase
MTDSIVPPSTYLERLAIDAEINLSDGHARQPLTAAELSIISDFGQYYDRALAVGQSGAEQRMADAFCELAGESRTAPTLYSYSVSSLVAVVASWLHDRALSVALLEPGFDNIRDLLIRAGVTLVPIRANGVCGLAVDPDNGKPPRVADALWLTLPNNPDGFVLAEAEFERLTQYCAAHSILLICDFCFRFYSAGMTAWSQYDCLERSGCRFIAFEDTGKTLPLLDIKVGMARCSGCFVNELAKRNEEVVLNVSPWIMEVITPLLKSYVGSGLDAVLWEPTRRRGQLVEEWAKGCGLRNMGFAGSDAPFSWLGLRDEGLLDAQGLVEAAARLGVHILPGHRFFFDRRSGQRLVRIPLSRPDSMLEAGLERLQSILAD